VILADLASAVDTVRLTLHVLAAAVWVGGQIVVAGLLPTLRSVGDDVPRRVAQAFARVQWPAYGLLLLTGVWNVAATSKHQPPAWHVVLAVKIGVVLLAGLGAFLHQRSTSKRGLAIWGAVAALASVAALVLGVLLAG
jgi:putative copper export protein